MNYDDTKSKFYQQGVEEYEHRRKTYNKWLDERVKQDKTLFASSMYMFNFVPQIPWQGTEKADDQCDQSLLRWYRFQQSGHYPYIVQLNDWLNIYVNLYGQMATTEALRDSLIPASAKTAIEKAKTGNPQVYGWMVDYFYKGFESNNIPAGMKVLESYLNDPNCLTSKRMEIERRLKGMETLVAGSVAPDIRLKDNNGSMFELNSYKTTSDYILLLFWSADCSHCTETVDALYPWQMQPGISTKISTVAISLDETETEMKAWDQKIKRLEGWKHLRTTEGIRSKVASDYFVLATPVLILLNSKTKEIVSLPSTLEQLKTELR